MTKTLQSLLFCLFTLASMAASADDFLFNGFRIAFTRSVPFPAQLNSEDVFEGKTLSCLLFSTGNELLTVLISLKIENGKIINTQKDDWLALGELTNSKTGLVGKGTVQPTENTKAIQYQLVFRQSRGIVGTEWIGELAVATPLSPPENRASVLNPALQAEFYVPCSLPR